MIDPLNYFLTFLKASLFSTGGFGNLPSLHQDLLANGWAEEADFNKAIAIGQITPGPNGLWVLALGYLTNGFLGLGLALLAITIPPFAVLVLMAFYKKIEQHKAAQATMRGLSLAINGLTLWVAISLIIAARPDWRGALIAIATFFIMISGRVHVIFVLALAGLAGWLLY